MRFHSSAWVAFALVLAALPRALSGQEVRGTVRDSASGEPVPGVVLLFFDSTGTSVGRNVTDDRGQFRLAYSPLIHRIRFVRLGFRPRELAMPRGVDRVAQLDVIMISLASMLEPVRVTSNPACPRRDDEAATFALLEQVRAGLLALVVARETNPGQMIRYRFERWMDGTSDRIIRQRIASDSTERGAVSFIAPRTPHDLVNSGFVTNRGARASFAGPDADVLLDTAFARGYCFHIADAERGRAAQVGLAFAAARRAPRRVDIVGTLWVDTVARVLVDIDYRYVGFGTQIDRFKPGGHIAFREMPAGLTLIDRWFIRMVQVQQDTIPGVVDEVRRRFYYKEDGGELAHARWPDHSWDASLGRLRGRVVTPAGAPAAGARVQLNDAPYETIADATGVFEISDLVPGPYLISIIDDRLESIRLDTADTRVRFTAVRDRTIQLTVTARLAEDLVAERCNPDRVYANRTLSPRFQLIGRVLSADDRPVAGATVRVWANETNELSNGGFPTMRTAADGTFQVCWGLVPNSRLLIRASRGRDDPVEVKVVLTDTLTVVPIRMP